MTIPKDFPPLLADYRQWPDDVKDRFVERLCIWSDGALLNKAVITDAIAAARKETIQ